jgi:hypothetical protein
MKETIGIYEEGKIIELYAGIHNIKILGSWLVSLNLFRVYLKEVNGDGLIYWKKRMFRQNDYVNGKKAKIVADIDIDKGGLFSIHFENASHVKVTYMGRFGLGLLSRKKILNKDIKIVIGE